MGNDTLESMLSDPMLTLQVGNQPTIYRIKKAGTSHTQKAVDIRFHALKDSWRTCNLALEYIPTQPNPADLLTKALAHTELHRKRALCSVTASAAGDDL
ncbi:hypothetical protein PINS_up016062 [Pythium insidiosum]|nr:hypothetical protein PINS_up016062 [Pythium insidiosum]